MGIVGYKSDMATGMKGKLKGNGIVLSPLFATTWRSAFVLTQIVLVWSLHLYGAGTRTNKLYNHRSL